MMYLCFKFPSKVIAHGLLYDKDGMPLYTDIADNMRSGLCVKQVSGPYGEYFTWPDDGSYCADIAGLAEVPAELAPFVITPNQIYRKHKFLGE